VVLLWQQGATASECFDPGLGATVRVFGSEKEMLAAWLEVVKQYDPDALVTFQVPSWHLLVTFWSPSGHQVPYRFNAAHLQEPQVPAPSSRV
jgi:hypothetical protein